MNHPRRFFEVCRQKGFRAAISITYNYIGSKIKSRIPKKRDFVRSQLLVHQPPTFAHAIYVKLYRLFLERQIGSGISVMDKDWDNLVLLDSYRMDYFRDYSSLEGDLSRVVSKGNWSLEFIINNFQGEEHKDTVVVTSNRYYKKFSKLEEGTFYRLITTYKEGPIGRTPEQVTEAAIDAMEKFPNKRLIVHYMKPHAPHMGETSNELRDALGEDFDGIFKLYKNNKISEKTLRQSYVDTIEVIENEVKKLVDEIDGKTVVSSDHGENLGEIQHGITKLRHGNETPECRYVPWLEMEYDTRRDIVADQPVGSDSVEEINIEEQLAALGYK